MRTGLMATCFILCLAIPALRAEDAAPAKADVAAEKIDLSKNGTYTSGEWTYTVKITAEGTKSQGVAGVLTYRGQPVCPDAKVNDWVVTPWGKLYCMGEVLVAWSRHGWMPEPKKNAAEGRQLDAPK